MIDTPVWKLSDEVEYLKTLMVLIDQALLHGRVPALSHENWGELHGATGKMIEFVERPESIRDHLQAVEKERDIMRDMLEVTNLRLEHQIEQLSLLRLIYDVTSHSVLLEDPLRFLLRQIVTVANAENGSIMLLDETKKRLVLKAASGAKDPSPFQISFELGEGIAGQVVEKGQYQLVDNTTQDPIFKSFGNKDELVKTLLCIPLICRKEVLGVLNLSSSRTHAFHQNIQRFLHVVAGYLGFLINDIKHGRPSIRELAEERAE